MTEESSARDAERAHDQHLSQFMSLNLSVISSASSAVQNLFLMHGGALVAMLTFAGGIMQKNDPSIPLESIMKPMIWFAVGVALATGASAGSYLTNYCHVSYLGTHRLDWIAPFSHETRSSRNWMRAAHLFHIVTLIAAIASLVVFVIGFFAVKSALLQ